MSDPEMVVTGDLQRVLNDLPPEWARSYVGILRPSGLRGNPPCPRFYMYMRRLRWVPKAFADSSALRIGTLFHQVMAGMAGGLSSAEAIGAVAEVVGEAADATQNDKSTRTLLKDWNVARVIADVWVDNFGSPSEQDDAEVVAAEQTIQYPLAELGIGTSLVGTVDLVTKRERGMFIEDWKTCGCLPSIRAKGLSFDTQAKCYRELWSAAHEDKPVVGFIHNIVMKPRIRVKKNQTYVEYYQEVREWYETEMLDNPNQAPMLRSLVAFNEPRMESNPEFLMMIQSEGAWATRGLSLDGFYRNRAQCIDPYGRPCPYLEFCSSDPVSWATKLTKEDSNFVKGDPPLERALKGSSDITLPNEE